MGKKFLVMVIFCCLLCRAEAVSARDRVSVLGFGGQVRDEYIQAAVNKLTAVLMKLDRFDVVERAEIDRILKEQHFQWTGLVEEEKAAQIGKILEINLAFIGSINWLTASWNSERQKYQSEAGITIKVIDIESGKILAVIEGRGSGTDKNYRGSLHRALNASFGGQLVYGLQEAFFIRSEVFRVEGGALYFLHGRERGVQKGMRYNILRPIEMPFYDWEMGEEFAFKERVGLVEVVDVLDNLSKADILWAVDTVKAGDILEEIARPRKMFFTVAPRITGYRLADGDRKENIVTWEARFGSELPFHSSSQLVFGFSFLDQVNTIDFGFEGDREFVLVGGRLYFIAGGGFGLSLAVQSEATAFGYYLLGTGGLKYYFNYDEGIRVELGVTGQYGPEFSHWYDEGNQDVTGDMTYQRIGFSGFGLRLGLVFPF